VSSESRYVVAKMIQGSVHWCRRCCPLAWRSASRVVNLPLWMNEGLWFLVYIKVLFWLVPSLLLTSALFSYSSICFD
jgi:hypothetical protein